MNGPTLGPETTKIDSCSDSDGMAMSDGRVTNDHKDATPCTTLRLKLRSFLSLSLSLPLFLPPRCHFYPRVTKKLDGIMTITPSFVLSKAIVFSSFFSHHSTFTPGLKNFISCTDNAKSLFISHPLPQPPLKHHQCHTKRNTSRTSLTSSLNPKVTNPDIRSSANTKFFPWVLQQTEIDAFFNTSTSQGLSAARAADLIADFGENKLPLPKPTPLLLRILAQFQDRLVLILIAAATVSLVLALRENAASQDRLKAIFEPAVIMTILVLNAIVGVVQEQNADNAIRALQQFEVQDAVVLRDASWTKIKATGLVPGDIVKLSVGERCPADIRLFKLQTSVLTADQSILTGESESVQKAADPIQLTQPALEDIVLQDKINIVFSGSTITRGQALGVVVATGIRTEIGKIRQNLDDSVQEIPTTPLQQKLDDFGEVLSNIILAICVVVWLININNFQDRGGFVAGAIYYFKFAVALAVAAVPEGLPAVVTTCLALGTKRMAQRNAIVRSLPSVETLGCTSVICSDKTGTLTKNLMTVEQIVVFEKKGDRIQPVIFSADKVSSTNLDSLKQIARISTLCNDSSISKLEDSSLQKIGEPTELALTVLAEQIGYNSDKDTASATPNNFNAVRNYWTQINPKLATLEFTRDRKSMSVLVQQDELNTKSLLVKGAPETILDRSTYVYIDHETIVPLNNELRAKILQSFMTLSKEALRCLAMAYTINLPDDFAPEKVSEFVNYESNLVLVGICGMLDPPREQVKDALQECRQAGIRVIVITGDNKTTAEAICKRIGLQGNLQSLTSYTGSEFDAMTDKEQLEAVQKAQLFSRVEPRHKQLLVTLLQKNGEIVAMTGDGVNDASALQLANIGIGMGSGTAVAKGASKIVLADDNFSTIVAAVEEGRAIFINLKHVIRYVISSNIGEVLCIFLTALTGLPDALVPVQLLWVNLVTDGLPATALSFNLTEKDVMQELPRKSNAAFVDKLELIRYIAIGSYVGVSTLAGFVYWFTLSVYGPHLSLSDLTHYHMCLDVASRGWDCSVFQSSEPKTVALSVLVMVEMFNALNGLSEKRSLFEVSWLSNKYLLAAIGLSISLHLMVVYIPFFNRIFDLSPIHAQDWIAIILLSAPVILIDEIVKFSARRSSSQ